MNNNNFGITSTSWQLILQTLKENEVVTAAWIFGSRAKGNYKPGSDIDLALEITPSDFATLSVLEDTFNEKLNIPYQVDLIDISTVQNQALREHIERVGVKIK